jgi:hypothetical protein
MQSHAVVDMVSVATHQILSEHMLARQMIGRTQIKIGIDIKRQD